MPRRYLKDAVRVVTLFLTMNKIFAFQGIIKGSSLRPQLTSQRTSHRCILTNIRRLPRSQAQNLSMVASEHEYSESIRRRNVPEHIASETDIFCNRELKMSSLKAIGFDMDYTLSRYYQEFDLLGEF
mmetsp:Transcript_33394/g.52550  ORF Transcript_33394/g.52550 Transcript_33394/m.52550 type:complete len:127 (-) Transcript_33394:10-390(-)